MARLNRRDFLKALGLSGVTAAGACGFDNNVYTTPIEQVLPYVVRSDQVVPGTPTFFATTVTSGPHAWPVLGNHREGRVVNVHANREAVGAAGAHTFAPAVPKAALFDLQRHFSPDRYRKPFSRSNGTMTELGWGEAVTSLRGLVDGARSSGKAVAWLGPYRSGSIAALLEDYTGGNTVFWEPLGPAAEATAWKLLTGMDGLPGYDLSQARFILSFGAEFLSWWGGAALESQYATARDPNQGGFVARHAVVSPRLDQTGAKADDWLRAAPGSEPLVAMAIAKIVSKKKGYTGPLAALLDAVDQNAAARASGLAPADLETLASRFVEFPAAVALPGGVSAASSHAVDLAFATYALNIVSGNAGTTFGVGYSGRIDGYDKLAALQRRMAAGEIGVLLVDDVDPIYALPDGADFATALSKVGTVVSVSSHSSATNATASLVLPVADAFEDWGDEDVAAEVHLLRQPVATALWGSTSLGDVLLASRGSVTLTAFAAGMAPSEGGAAPAPAGAWAPANWLDYVKTRWKNLYWSNVALAPSFEAWWQAVLARGVYVSGDASLHAPPAAAGSYAFDPAGIERTGELKLLVYPHAHRWDGRYANQPWAQETPDPLTGQTWDSWVEISPATAARLGLSDGDLCTLKTDSGSVQAGVEVFKGVRDDVVALAFGQGASASGRYADGVGVRAPALLAPVQDRFGQLVWQQAAVTVSGPQGKAHLAPFFGADSDGGREIGRTVSAEALQEHGDAPSEHPGSLANVHEFVFDERLTKDQLDFYPMTDHPTYRFGMTVDTSACTGCGTCIIACYAENNLPVVGKPLVRKGRMMNWLRINRYWEGTAEQPDIRFVPMMCQHCAHAPCESVCPVLATYHTIDGLNAMIYNRCVGTRYCANNCPYLARRFNFHQYTWPEPFNLQLNPDVNTRTMGVMEKCTFCVQRIRATKSAVRDAEGYHAVVRDEYLEQLPACADACPSQALTFGNLVDPESKVSKSRASARSYIVLDDLNAMSAVNYLAKASWNASAPAHGGGHAAAGREAGGAPSGHATDEGADAPHTTPADH